MATPSGPTHVQVNDLSNYSITSNPNETYNWDVSGGIIQTGQGTPIISVLWTNEGEGRVDVTVTKQGEKPVTDGITIIIDPDQG